jgi:hypothetical protein
MLFLTAHFCAHFFILSLQEANIARNLKLPCICDVVGEPEPLLWETKENERRGEE